LVKNLTANFKVPAAEVISAVKGQPKRILSSSPRVSVSFNLIIEIPCVFAAAFSH
jgi:hypothetical protein